MISGNTGVEERHYITRSNGLPVDQDDTLHASRITGNIVVYHNATGKVYFDGPLPDAETLGKLEKAGYAVE